jgi:hypothetical protein
LLRKANQENEVGETDHSMKEEQNLQTVLLGKLESK